MRRLTQTVLTLSYSNVSLLIQLQKRSGRSDRGAHFEKPEESYLGQINFQDASEKQKV